MKTRAIRDWGFCVLLAVPFLWLIGEQFLVAGSEATGFVTYDLPVYLSLARSIFAHGNGILYSNPYDFHGPIIYFQWFTWLLGFGTAKLGIDGGLLYMVLGVVFAVALARVTLELVRLRTGLRYDYSITALAFWGGGLLCVGGLLRSALHGTPLTWGEIMQFDPQSGFWFLNWGRNSLFTSEALYHVLVGVLWLAVLRTRWAIAIGSLFLLVSTHPWTGAEMLGILLAFLAWQYLLKREKPPAWYQLSLIAVTAAFAWYYGWFLNSFPQHRAIVSQWSLPIVIHTPAFLLSVVLVAIPVAIRLIKKRKFNVADEFLLICFACSTVLTLHDRFMHPVQPLHFDRGYPWMALFLLGAPVLPGVIDRARASFQRWQLAAIGIPILVLVCSDNAIFLGLETAAMGDIRNDVTLTPAERNIALWLDSTGRREPFLASNSEVSYIISAYSNIQPYTGLTDYMPNLRAREDSVRKFYAGDTAFLPKAIRLILVTPDDSREWVLAAGWREVYKQDGIFLYAE